jgi:hypothetical protein
LSIQLSNDDTVALDGDCSIEDAETLWQLLITHPHAAVDWSACTGAHTAVIQLLLVAKRRMQGPPASDFLRRHVQFLFSPDALAR